MSTSEEQVFIQKALAKVEKAEKVLRLKQIVMTCVLFLFVFWFAFKPTSPEMQVECVLIMAIAGICGVCTTKIMGLVNRNTKDLLTAIANLRAETKDH